MCFENITSRQGEVYNIWAKWSEQDDKLVFFKHDPDAHQQQTISRQQEQSHQQSESLGSGVAGLFDLPTNGGDDHE